jgi:hypothetical protein
MSPAASVQRRAYWRFGVLAMGVAVLVLVAVACTREAPRATSAAAPSSAWPWARWTTWQYNPWSSVFPTSAQGSVYLPLAIQNWPSLTSFTPQLATSWSVQAARLLLRLGFILPALSLLARLGGLSEANRIGDDSPCSPASASSPPEPPTSASADIEHSGCHLAMCRDIGPT